MELTQEIIGRFLRLDTAMVGRYIGTGCLHPRVSPVKQGDRVAGPAYPVRIPGRDVGALHLAVQKAPVGAVIVVDRGHDDFYAAVDYELALMARHRGLAGIVVDGPAANRTRLAALDFPVFCTGFSTATCLIQGIAGESEVAAVCGGVVVNPGDLVIGDADGVIVLAPQGIEAMLHSAEAEMDRTVERDKRILEEGYRFVAHETLDVETFLESDVLTFIDTIKKECPYC